jgi:hypothetical protein
MFLGNVLRWVGGVLALVPELVSDPAMVLFMSEMLSPWTRRAIAAATFVLGFYVRHLRKNTSAPIAGTALAEKLPTAKGEDA